MKVASASAAHVARHSPRNGGRRSAQRSSTKPRERWLERLAAKLRRLENLAVSGGVPQSKTLFDTEPVAVKRSASATVNQLDEAALKEVVERSEHSAKLAPEDSEYVPNLGGQSYPSVKAYGDLTRTGAKQGMVEGSTLTVRSPHAGSGWAASGANSIGGVDYARWNDSPVSVLSNIDAMSESVRASSRESTATNISVPALRVKEFELSSVSDAV
jgi:hypothetical protein